MTRIPWPEVIHKGMVLLGFMALLTVTSEANVKSEGKILPLHFDIFRSRESKPSPLLANMCGPNSSRETPRLPAAESGVESCGALTKEEKVSVQ